VKVLWNAKSGDSTRELKENMREVYPYLFPNKLISMTKYFLVWENKDLKNSLRIEVVHLK